MKPNDSITEYTRKVISKIIVYKEIRKKQTQIYLEFLSNLNLSLIIDNFIFK